MRGCITRVSRKEGSGCILAEDGKEVHFDRSGMGGNDVGHLRVGRRVEFELQYGFERLSAVNIRYLRSDVGQ
jgi:cold shock CspA family protein